MHVDAYLGTIDLLRGMGLERLYSCHWADCTERGMVEHFLDVSRAYALRAEGVILETVKAAGAEGLTLREVCVRAKGQLGDWPAEADMETRSMACGHLQRLASRGLVLADPGELQRVLLNLCTNAAHAMRDGGGRLEVGLEDVALDDLAAAARLGLERGRWLRLTVADTGCGMTAEVKARIFEPFFTTRKQGEGTGLGLSIVHGVIKRLGGAIHVESAPGMGTTFDVWLPALPEWAGIADRLKRAAA